MLHHIGNEFINLGKKCHLFFTEKQNWLFPS